MTEEPFEESSLGEELGIREEPSQPGGRRRRNRRSYLGCLVVLVILALLAGLVFVGLTRGVDWAKDYFGDPDDYEGSGHGKIEITVEQGDSATDIAHILDDKDVVASYEAFIDEANSRSDEASHIQPGVYDMKLQMSAEDAFDVLARPPAHRPGTPVSIPEGKRTVDVVELLAKKTRFSRAQFQKVIDHPTELGLPAYAHGNVEGYLFPATYDVLDDDTPLSILRRMVNRWREAADEVGLEDAASEVGRTPAEVMVVASLIEAEAARDQDRPKVARVIYNRLTGEETNGLLQIDATVDYALGRPLTVGLTQEEQQGTDSPYNTYRYPGLPPGPIGNPGAASIEAALHPADGDWYYYITVNLATGETKFAETYSEFLEYKAEKDEYCATESASGCQ